MTWIIVCIIALVVLAIHLRSAECSLGLPFAYLALLEFNHVPGAFVHEEFLFRSRYVEIGIYYTAIGAVAFVAGTWIASIGQIEFSREDRYNRSFLNFCLTGGWSIIVLISVLPVVPSLNATLDKSAAIWLIAVALGLRSSVFRSHAPQMLGWTCALFAYPIWSLLVGGFLSYGSTAIFIALSSLVVSVRRGVAVIATCCLLTFLGLTVFVNWFAGREMIREQVWGGAPIADRIETVVTVFSNFSWFSPSNEMHLYALDARLNQNYFVGLAADRLETGQVDYLYGSSLWEAFIAVIPRAIWPDKPVYGGSPELVARMTGLWLDPNTSFGVGNVMEFYINFGIAGVIAGFLILGWALGKLDRKAAQAAAQENPGRIFLYFLPAAALIQPLGSLVELCGGAAAAFVAAQFWKWLWERRLRAAHTNSKELIVAEN